MIGLCTQIKQDVFDIARRLREIDRGYYVIYHYKKRRFEVHNSRQRGGSFCLAVPFNRLDCRIVNLVRSTRRERAAEFFAEMDAENKRIERRDIAAAVREAERKTEAALRGKG